MGPSAPKLTVSRVLTSQTALCALGITLASTAAALLARQWADLPLLSISAATLVCFIATATRAPSLALTVFTCGHLLCSLALTGAAYNFLTLGDVLERIFRDRHELFMEAIVCVRVSGTHTHTHTNTHTHTIMRSKALQSESTGLHPQARRRICVLRP